MYIFNLYTGGANVSLDERELELLRKLFGIERMYDRGRYDLAVILEDARKWREDCRKGEPYGQ